MIYLCKKKKKSHYSIQSSNQVGICVYQRYTVQYHLSDRETTKPEFSAGLKKATKYTSGPQPSTSSASNSPVCFISARYQHVWNVHWFSSAPLSTPRSETRSWLNGSSSFCVNQWVFIANAWNVKVVKLVWLQWSLCDLRALYRLKKNNKKRKTQL